MDPALQELIRPDLDPDEVIEALVRFKAPFQIPEKIRVISQFGDIATIRIRRADVQEVYHHPSVRSLKAAKLVGFRGVEDQPEQQPDAFEPELSWADELPADATGRGVVIAVLDWGGDFAHRDFISPGGESRFMAIWDQRPVANSDSPKPFGYGKEYQRADINVALSSSTPYTVLGYRPEDGAHGTLVAGIAAGNGTSGQRGVAPEADLVFVHLATSERTSNPLLDLSDSVRLLEAIDYVRHLAEDRPLVINMSLGAHAGAHDGNTLFEIAVDNFLAGRPNTMICQSVGNYFSNKTHHHGKVKPGKTVEFAFTARPRTAGQHELDIWYAHKDRLIPVLRHPGSGLSVTCPPGDQADIMAAGRKVGKIYHRLNEPNSGKHNIAIFLYPSAPSGRWVVQLQGRKVLDGRYFAWLERDATSTQARFEDPFVRNTSTNGTITNGYHTLVVGAVDQANMPAVFSSSGPTTDGRPKPDIVAPGVNIRGPRAAPAGTNQQHISLKQDQGTSFSTPQVTGAVALMLQRAAKPIDAVTLRTLVLSAAGAVPTVNPVDADRIGSGLLNIEGGLRAMIQHQQQIAPNPHRASIDQTYNQATDMEQIVIGNAAGNLYLLPNATPTRISYRAGVTAQNYSNLDDALRAALRRRMDSFVIRGSLFALGQYQVEELNLPFCPITPAVIRFQPTALDACCLILEGTPYFKASFVPTEDKWVQFYDLEDFYQLPNAQQQQQLQAWRTPLTRVIQQLQVPGITISSAIVNQLSVPALRLLIANFPAAVYTVSNHRNGGAVYGITQPPIPIPLEEPACYIRVIAQVEGLMESVNAWDAGAGISIGPVQFNVQKGAIFKFLWRLWQDDHALFNTVFSQFGWSMLMNQQQVPVLRVQPPQGAAAFDLEGVGDGPNAAPIWQRSIRYFTSGNPQVPTANVAFRRSLAQQFAAALAWPHVQALVFEVSKDYLQPGLARVRRISVGPISTANPGLEEYCVAAQLLSAFVRASGCASHLIRAVGRYPSIQAKYNNLQREADGLQPIRSFNCANEIGPRMSRQRGHARTIHGIIQQMLQPAAAPAHPAAPAAPQGATPPAPAPSDWAEFADQTVWAGWTQQQQEQTWYEHTTPANDDYDSIVAPESDWDASFTP